VSEVPEIVGQDNTDLTRSRENVKGREQRRWKTNSEIKADLSGVEKPRDKILILTLYLTGLRVSEVINIRRRDLDFQRQEIIARWQKNKKWKNRTVAMHSQLLTPLQFYTSSMNRDKYVFDFTRQTAYNICKKHLGLSPHDLRHSFAVHVLDNVDDALGIVKLSRCLGHSNVRTTMEYLKINPKEQKRFLEKVQF